MPFNLTCCTDTPYLKWIPMIFHKIPTVSRKAKLETCGFHWILNLNWSSHFLVCYNIFFVIGWFLLLLTLQPLIMLVRWVIHLHRIHFIYHIEFGSLPLVCPITSNIVLIIFNVPRYKVVKTLHVTFLRYLTLTLARQLVDGWVQFDDLDSCCAELLTFSNLDRPVTNEMIYHTLGHSWSIPFPWLWCCILRFHF